MKKQRVPETNHGITGEMLVQDYDEMQKKLCERGLLKTNEIIKSGIIEGEVLEIGPGPGYLGLEWLKKCSNASLSWLDISEDMIKLAKINAEKYGVKENLTIKMGDATEQLPFSDCFFDGVFTANSLHEWENPVNVINEIERVLKVGGNFFIGDLKRNTNPLIFLLMKANLKKQVMKQGLKSSINAAYTKNEILLLLKESNFKTYEVTENYFGLSIFGKKVDK
ncbi:class I SAM-dependent methyltransferase [Haliovirga abyssi]|uniref:Methyltransferase domain-containing protein n=1 Tax=Haliovirga abyssi TaxID=2996794 RepID=A0AAU9D5F8_9FUSO|nr:class I SAM-dependent methyltransferase [Haliovirga abyssi]BDU51311.1 hypothetical protein HLVA_18800 [Haliovirga abyssi]